MRFQLLRTAFVAFISLASALPASETDHIHQKRDVTISNPDQIPKLVRCGAKGKYNKAEITNALKKGGDATMGKTTVGGRYPFPIKDPENLPGLPTIDSSKALQHFPMKNGKSAYKGGNVKDERVMYSQNEGDTSLTYVGLWTHEGADKGQFVQCTEDTTDATYAPGWCGVHITQYQKNEGPVNKGKRDTTADYRFDVFIYDSAGTLIGEADLLDIPSGSTASVIGDVLPNAFSVTAPNTDGDAVYMTYGDQNWGSNDQAHQCNFGQYDSGNRDGDCGFTC